MNRDSKKTRYGVTAARILLALTFIVLGIMYFAIPAEKMGLDMTTQSGQFMMALGATGYFLTFLKVVEIICGLMLLSKRWSALALVILAPILIHIFLANSLLAPVLPSNVIMSLVMGVLGIYIAWYNWPKYRPLFQK
jgi:putative oxidoreductase